MRSNNDQAPMLLTSKQVADRLGVSERTVFTLCATGQLLCIKIGAAKRFPLSSLETFIASKLEGAKVGQVSPNPSPSQ